MKRFLELDSDVERELEALGAGFATWRPRVGSQLRRRRCGATRARRASRSAGTIWWSALASAAKMQTASPWANY